MNAHASNLIIALHTAIETRSAWEKERFGPNFESGIVAGWKTVMQALQRGEDVWVTPLPAGERTKARVE